MPPKLGTPSAAAKQGQDDANQLPSPAPLPAPSSATADTQGGASDDHPFIRELRELRSTYGKASSKNLFYYRSLCTGALVVALLLFLSVVFRRDPTVVELMNPFYKRDSGLFGLLLALCNVLLVVGLIALGELKACADHNRDMAKLTDEVIDAAIAAAGGKSSGSLSDDALGQLEGKKAAIGREAERKPLAPRDPVALCLYAMLGGPLLLKGYLWLKGKACPCLPAPDESLLGDMARSDDLEVGMSMLPAGMMDAIEKATGIDLDGDGAVAGAPATPKVSAEVKPAMAPRRPGQPAPPAAPAAAASSKPEESDFPDSDDDPPSDDSDDDAPIKQNV